MGIDVVCGAFDGAADFFDGLKSFRRQFCGDLSKG